MSINIHIYMYTDFLAQKRWLSVAEGHLALHRPLGVIPNGPAEAQR